MCAIRRLLMTLYYYDDSEFVSLQHFSKKNLHSDERMQVLAKPSLLTLTIKINRMILQGPGPHLKDYSRFRMLH